MLRDTSAASTSSKSTLSAADACAGASARAASSDAKTVRATRMSRTSAPKAAEIRPAGSLSQFAFVFASQGIRAESASLRSQRPDRKGDLDQRSGIRSALDAEFGMIRRGQCLGERQAKTATTTAPARAPARRRRGLPERIEGRFDIFFLHAGAGIAHPQNRVAAVGT